LLAVYKDGVFSFMYGIVRGENSCSSDPILPVAALNHVLVLLDTEIVTEPATFRISLPEVQGSKPALGLR
jgi:hypothetical protein